jgi:hypothetical protein
VSYIGLLKCLAAAGTVVTVLFLARYSFLARWWRTPMGRHMWWFSLLNAEFFALFAWSLFVGPKLPYQRALTALFMAQFVVLSGWRWWLFEAEQRRGQHELQRLQPAGRKED